MRILTFDFPNKHNQKEKIRKNKNQEKWEKKKEKKGVVRLEKENPLELYVTLNNSISE